MKKNQKERVKFNEEQDVVEFELEGMSQEFTSDDNEDVDSEYDEGEILDDSEANKTISEAKDPGSDNEMNTDEDVPSQPSQGHDQLNLSQKKMRSMAKHPSMEEQLNQMASSLFSMQQVLQKKGFFNEADDETAQTSEDNRTQKSKKKGKSGIVTSRRFHVRNNYLSQCG